MAQERQLSKKVSDGPKTSRSPPPGADSFDQKLLKGRYRDHIFRNRPEPRDIKKKPCLQAVRPFGRSPAFHLSSPSLGYLLLLLTVGTVTPSIMSAPSIKSKVDAEDVSSIDSDVLQLVKITVRDTAVAEIPKWG
jgi:hypothetical protein